MSILYKPLTMLVGVLGGMAAGAIFKQVWKLASGDDDAPDANDLDRSWKEVLAAAALQGMVFGLVKAAVDRATTQSLHRASGNRARK